MALLDDLKKQAQQVEELQEAIEYEQTVREEESRRSILGRLKSITQRFEP
jgi:hypothetical protein